MAAPSPIRAALGAIRRAKIAPLRAVPGVRHTSTLLERHVTSEGLDIVELAEERGIELADRRTPITEEQFDGMLRLPEPYNIRAARLEPLRRAPTYGIPSCDLQLRTYSLPNMDLFADFAMRAAYYLHLPAKGPIPLPKITERWTVPRSNFVHKKSQENFERITLRRLIQIQDGHPEVVRKWLGILAKHQYHGVGMKANIWEHDSLDAAQRLDQSVSSSKAELDEVWNGYGARADRLSDRKLERELRHPQYGGIVAELDKEQDFERGEFQERVRRARAERRSDRKHERELQRLGHSYIVAELENEQGPVIRRVIQKRGFPRTEEWTAWRRQVEQGTEAKDDAVASNVEVEGEDGGDALTVETEGEAPPSREASEVEGSSGIGEVADAVKPAAPKSAPTQAAAMNVHAETKEPPTISEITEASETVLPDSVPSPVEEEMLNTEANMQDAEAKERSAQAAARETPIEQVAFSEEVPIETPPATPEAKAQPSNLESASEKTESAAAPSEPTADKAQNAAGEKPTTSENSSGKK